jgi:hypothetical protein
MATTEKARYANPPPVRFFPFLRFATFLFLFSLSACQSFPRFTVEPLPRYEALFERTAGWTGGDGAYSTALGDGRFLWLFGDTFVGEVRGNRRINAALVNNSAAVQHGEEPGEAAVAFYYKTLRDGSAAPFIQPKDRNGWFWPHHSVQTPEGLFLFLLQVERTGPTAFGFRATGNWLARVLNPEEPPDRWIISQQKIPWGNGRRQFGSFILTEDNYCYIYGTAEEKGRGAAGRHMLLARAPLDRLGDFDAWRFFADGEWIADVDRAGRICENVASEFSVSFQKGLSRYLLVYTEGGVSPNIVIRQSRALHGPWSAPIRAYRCPEAARDPRIFCYGAKGHPEVSTHTQELIVTYCANSTDFDLILSDANLYRPHFLRIFFNDPGRNKN